MPELRTNFQSLPEEYQQIIRLAQDTYRITVTPLQLLVGGWFAADGDLIACQRLLRETDVDKIEKSMKKQIDNP